MNMLRGSSMPTRMTFCIALYVVLIQTCAARTFVLVDSSGDQINTKEDHIELRLEGGWISSSRKGLLEYFKNVTGAFVQLTTNAVFDSTDQSKVLKIDNMAPIKNAKNSMARPIPFDGAIVPEMPADIDQLLITAKMEATTAPIITSVISGLEKAAPKPGVELSSPEWMGYAKVLSSILESFDASTTKAILDVNTKLSKSDLKRETYLLFVEPMGDDDSELATAIPADFSIKGNSVVFKGSALVNRSYLIVGIRKVDDLRTPQTRAISSSQPWAVLIRTQLEGYDAYVGQDLAQMKMLTDGYQKLLASLKEFVAKDVMFSNFDRASTLLYYYEDGIARFERACSKISVSCPVEKLNDERIRLSKAFGIPIETAQRGALEIKIATETKISISAARAVANLLPPESRIIYKANNLEMKELVGPGTTKLKAGRILEDMEKKYKAGG